jgi:hypothetical protein
MMAVPDEYAEHAADAKKVSEEINRRLIDERIVPSDDVRKVIKITAEAILKYHLETVEQDKVRLLPQALLACFERAIGTAIKLPMMSEMPPTVSATVKLPSTLEYSRKSRARRFPPKLPAPLTRPIPTPDTAGGKASVGTVQNGPNRPKKAATASVRLADTWLPPPRILHPWPERRFAVRHPRWQPYARIGPVRIYAGGAR